jgi:hypothetical protein
VFKIGQKVRCIDTRVCAHGRLDKGRVYTVSDIYDDFIRVDGKGAFWRRSRFTPAAPTLLGLCGRAGAGKDAVADILVEQHGWVKVGWADPLYRLALWLNPRIWMWRRLDYYVRRDGWTAAKRIPAVRQFLQRLGTEGCRERMHPDVWIMVTAERIKTLLDEGKSVVITNCRFNNEAEWVIDQGGEIVKVTRPGVGACNDHVSEAGEADEYASRAVYNNGTLTDLQRKVGRLLDA